MVILGRMGADGRIGFQPLLESLDVRILTVQRTAAGTWWNYARVNSPFSRLWLGIGGGATVQHHGRNFQLRPGRLHLVPAFTPHDCHCAGSFDHYHLHLSARLPTGIDLFSLLEGDWDVAASPEALGWLERLEAIYPERKLPCFDPFVEEYRRHSATMEHTQGRARPAEWLEAQGLVRLLLAPFLRMASLHEDGMHAQVNQRFEPVQQYIHEHMAEPIRLRDLAEVTGLHPTYFSDLFLETVGLRPLAYLARRRIERAQYLLLTSSAPVKEVAFMVGLPDPAYFTRVFTRCCHVSPSTYRATHGRQTEVPIH